ncbi:MAG TPA: hypothetical protein VFO62_10320 [Candidatus Binatia bacterium]|nr:hypothetical protein [Candidatus Binatia bacterium]
MAATGRRKITVTYFGDVGGASPGYAQEISAADNLSSPAQIQILTLAAGDNTITAPGGGSTPKACTIVKPAGNTVTITLKGAGGDTGIPLDDTDPDTISGGGGFILNAAAEVVGVRLFWT